MKKKLHYILILFLLLLNPFLTDAQFYIGINTNYSVGANGRSLQEFLLMDATVDQTTFQNTIIEKKVSFGGGWFASPIIGYQFNKYAGMELQGAYYKTKTASSTINYINQSDNKVNIRMNGNVTSFRPSLIGYVYKDKPLIYIKAGAVYSVCAFTIDVDVQNEQKQTSILINGGKSLGISFGAGADWSISKRWFLRTELNYINANYFPTKGSFTKYNVSGIDQLSSMSNKNKTIHYVKQGDVQSTYMGACLESGTHLSPQIPMSSLGLNISLIYKLIKRKNN